MSWLSGWGYRKSHEIVGSTAGAVTDYQVRVKAHYGSGDDSGEDVYLNEHCRTDFGDVRFTDSDGETEIPYWMEEKVDGDYAVFWVKVPSIPQPHPKVESGSWTVDGNTYHHRTKITITEKAGQNLTDYQVRVVLNTKWLVDNGYATANGNEVRFTDSDGSTLLDFWRETDFNQIQTVYWVKVPSIPANSTKDIYIYYDEELTTVPDASNGDNTFLFWDDFSTPDKWSLYTGASIHDGIFDATLGSSDYCPETTVGTIPNKGVAVEASVKVVSRTGPNAGWDVGIPSNTAGDNDGAVSGNWYLIAFESAGYYRIWEHTGTSYTKIREISYSFPTGVFKRISARISQNAKIEFYVDETLIDSFTDSTPIPSGQGYLAWREGDVEIDWVAVRKYVDPEPSVEVEYEGQATIYIYYGNPSATTTSNGDDTFIKFDDTETDQLTTKWTIAGGTWSFDSANKEYDKTSTNNEGVIRAKPELSIDYGFEFECDIRGSENDQWTHEFAYVDGRYLTGIWDYENQIRIMKAGSIKASVSFSPTAGRYYNLKTRRDQNGKWTILVDDVEKLTWTDTEILAVNVGIRIFNDTGSVRKIKCRKFIDPEPTHGAWGAEEALALIISVSDLSSGSEFVAEFSLERFDLGYSFEKVMDRTLTILDSSIGAEIAKVFLSLLDSGISLDTSLFIDIPASDSSSGSEVRLSPIPILRSDVASSIDKITRKDMRYLKDVASHLEQAFISLFLLDQASTIEHTITEKLIKDIASGFEVRLSPQIRQVLDLASGLDYSWFYYWEGIVGDIASGTEITKAKNMTAYDLSSGLEKLLFGRLIRDQASTLERIIHSDRTFLDAGLGSEVRLSPIPITRPDYGVGYEIGWLSYKEELVSDFVSAFDRIARKGHIQPDTASTIEQAIISLQRIDQALSLEKIIYRTLLRPDFSSGSEVRLSPIPIAVLDATLGYERSILDKVLQLFDSGLGLEAISMEVYLAPLTQLISSLRETSTHVGVNETSLTSETLTALTYSKRSIPEPARTLEQSVTSEKTCETRGITGFTRQMQLLISSLNAIDALSRMLIQEILLQSLQSIPSTFQRGITGFTRQLPQSLSSTHSILTEYRLVYPYQIENTIAYSYNYELLPDRVLSQSLSEPLYLAKTHNMRNTALPSVTHVNKLYLSPFSRTSLESTLKTTSVMNLLYTMISKAEPSLTSVCSSISKMENLLFNVRAISHEKETLSTQMVNEILHKYKYEAKEIYIPSIALTSKIILEIEQPFYSFRYEDVMLHLPIYLGFQKAIGYRAFIIEIINSIIKALSRKPIFITKAYKFLIDLQDLVAKFRYVQAGDYVLHTDHNLFVDFCNLFFKFATQLVTDLFPEDVEVHVKLSNLGSAIGKLRKVYVFDIVSARDHNTVVDAILKMREFISKVREKLGLPT